MAHARRLVPEAEYCTLGDFESVKHNGRRKGACTNLTLLFLVHRLKCIVHNSRRNRVRVVEAIAYQLCRW